MHQSPPTFVLASRKLNLDLGLRIIAASLGINNLRGRLMKNDPLALIERGEGKHYFLLLHLAGAHPNVGGNPVPVGTRGNDHDFVIASRQLATQVHGGGMTGNTRT